MRVLSITPTFFPQLGGLEQVVMELARRVRTQGVEMDIAHVAPGLEASSELMEGITVYRVPLRGHRIIGWAPQLRALCRRYDLLHVHDPQLLAITTNVRLNCGATPAVLSTHGGFWHTRQHRLFKRLYEISLLRGAANHYRRILATSVGDLAYYRRYSDRVDLCSNGVHVKRFGTVSQSDRTGALSWIYWGRLSRNKRVDLAIDYVAYARHSGFPVELLICGQDFDGLLPELKAQVARLQLDDAVRFEPFLDDASLRLELAKRSVYITASDHEGFGLSVVEAMAAGLIVICRDMVPLNSFVVDGRSGCLLDFDGSAADLARLRHLLGRDQAQLVSLSKEARAAASGYDWDAAAPRFIQHYRQVLAVCNGR